jgi:hypothetical protein
MVDIKAFCDAGGGARDAMVTFGWRAEQGSKQQARLIRALSSEHLCNSMLSNRGTNIICKSLRHCMGLLSNSVVMAIRPHKEIEA